MEEKIVNIVKQEDTYKTVELNLRPCYPVVQNDC
jgi:hypothetical protein